MKNLKLLVLVWSAFASVAQAASNITSLPECGLSCIVGLVAKSPCSLTNITCVCTNQQLSDTISLCLESNCTIREQLSTLKYSKETCGAPVVNRGKLVVLTCTIPSSVAFLAFFLRIGLRIGARKGRLGLDDLCLAGTMLLNVPFTVFSVLLTNRGLGKDIWEVPFDSVTDMLHLYFWAELIYIAAFPLIKISILFFYLRIFPDSRFRQITWILIVIHIAYMIAFFFATLFQCRPIEGAWTRWDGTFQGTCSNINIQIWISAAVNIILDVAMLCLPLPSLYRLNLSLRKKLQILVMFSVGFFVTLVSILRLQSLVEMGTSTNPTQDYISIGYWSTIEVHVGVICACMPDIRALYQRAFPRTFESTAVSSKPYQSNTGSKSRIASSFPRDIKRLSKQNDNSSAHELIESGELISVTPQN